MHMAILKVELPVRVFEQQKANDLCTLFSGANISWFFCQKETYFHVKTIIEEKYGDLYRHQLLRTRKMLKLFPNDESLKEDLTRYEEKAKNDKIYDVTVIFEGEIAAEIDIFHNSILQYTGPIDTDMTRYDISRLKKLIESYPLDEFYEEKIKKFLICIIMACVIAEPGLYLGCGGVNLWIDEQKYLSDTFLKSPLHTEAFSRHQEIMLTSLDYSKAFLWIKNYTKLQEDSQTPPVPFTMLTYLFNRDSHESLLYSVIGLENLYSAKNGGIAYTLQNRINYLFPSITKEQIKSIYSQRSDFVHGKIKISMCEDYSDTINGFLQFDDAAILACALLLETMRMLAANEASKITFNEQLSHKFI